MVPKVTSWLGVALLSTLPLWAARWPTRALPAARAAPGRTLSGWLPWWSRERGVERLLPHLDRFHSVSPFAFRVRSDGSVRNRLGWPAPAWTRLADAARKRHVVLLPTVVWSDPGPLHATLSDPRRRARHLRALVDLARDFDGLDIDYERMRVDSRPFFSALIEALARALHTRGQQLACTIEPREARHVPGERPGARSAWAQDHAVLGRACDAVRVMAYDQWRAHHSDRFEGDTQRPQVSHADLAWVERVVRATLRTVPARKLWLGAATYGWEFRVRGGPGAWRYERHRARSFSYVHKLPPARQQRAAGGELVFDVLAPAGRSLVIMPDAHTVARRAQLARRLGLAGLALFKLDGREDPRLWRALER